MKKSLHSRTVPGPVGVIRGGGLVAVMLAALALPVAADTLSADSDAVLEGRDLKIEFTTSSPMNSHVRYKYKTQDGSATSGYDYESTSGTIRWGAGASDATPIVTVETEPDQLCEYDETVKVILSEPEYSIRGSNWLSFCYNNRGWPCNFEAELTIKEDPNDCQGGTFGE